MLAQAGWAALHNQQNAYQTALKQAMDLVKKYCHASASQQAWLKQGAELAHQPVAYKTGAINQNFQQLNSLVNALTSPHGITPTVAHA